MFEKNIHILGIETSCDETSASVVNSNKKVLSNLVLSQLKEHKEFGGVVPEIAARAHVENLDRLIKAALQDANIAASELDAIAATCGPGLIGGVMIGAVTGKAMASALRKPFIAVNHLEGHALTPRLTDNVEFPYLLLLISGGHTQILVAEGVRQYKRWGSTLDDAAGECFDKSAKLMGLPYPGGPELQKIAAECSDPIKAAERFPLPSPMKGRKELNFSFSGLKTAIRNHVEKLPAGDLQRDDIAELACAFQNQVASVITDRIARSLIRFKEEYQSQDPTLVASGGVAANTAIRAALKNKCSNEGFRFYAPPLELCGDNAAMIAWAGIEQYNCGMRDCLDFKARPRWPLDPNAEALHGGGVKA